MNKTILITGVIFGCTAIILGAFGAHGLEKLVDAKALSTFETGVKYQMYHALFLLVLGSFNVLAEEQKGLIYYFVTVGVVFFSFSIYLLATNSLTSYDFKTIALMTPLGGSLLIIGWIILGFRLFSRKQLR
ncbi:Uncharacterized membrane protein YgdD, TMEM256/DUF423 family [Arenibacter nanhaiticus]|uniref:Uncharacterized membrane protein YgdD, TMEM256/DUF423 family n=1 Tax=Arenibacter nanhaiticus TaxID=558155 RepID=A0A1M6JP28_9FLAO|nr:DUF423 domain-containing protein [Arenibacter nanhaiticus]SHJ48333.1 Uncharacterized membrane protein YgdD, TMEM256/DUF423 family [Arenibacter nanhaiticus]